MATFVLVPGAGGVAWYWHRIVPLLEQARHDAIAVDLPGDDKQAGSRPMPIASSKRSGRASGPCRAVARRFHGAAGVRAGSHSHLVFVNAMIPVPGETAGEWWDNTGSTAARIAAAHAAAMARTSTSPRTSCTTFRPTSSSKARRTSARRPTSCSATLAASRRGPTFLSTLSPAATIGSSRSTSSGASHGNDCTSVDELTGGHLVALSNPRGLVDQLLGYLRAGPE